MKANQQSLTSRVRENFRRELRKKQLERQFAEHRRNWQLQAQRSEKEWFSTTYPLIDEQNYQQHLHFLLHFANNPNYNYQLLPLAGYAYEAFIQDPLNQQPLLILEALSSYEEIELPQTEQFVEGLMVAMEVRERTKAVLSLIANLLSHRRYQQELRDLLLEAGFIRRGQMAVNWLMEQDMKSEDAQLAVSPFFFSCCCEFVKSHPPIDRGQLEGITLTMSCMLTGPEQRFLLFDTLSSISSSFQPHKQLAQHLFIRFTEVAIREYHNYEYEILHFMHYCLRAGLQMPQLQQLLIGSLDSHDSYIVEKALIVLQTQLGSLEEFQREKVYEEGKEQRLVSQLRVLMMNGKEEVQLECLECLRLLVRIIIMDEEELDQASFLVLAIAAALENPSHRTIKPSLELFLITLQAFYQEKPHNSTLPALVQREGLALKVQSIDRPTQEVEQLIDGILHLLPQRQQ